MSSTSRVLILLLRRDLRLHDNPLFFHASKSTKHTHILPLYVFNPFQIEVSGLCAPDSKSPFPECRSSVARFWRCGPHRARFLAESLWDVKDSLKSLGSDLVLRVGKSGEVVKGIIEGLREVGFDVKDVWMAGAVGVEEKDEEKAVRNAVKGLQVEFRAFDDGGYLFGREEFGFDPDHPKDLPDVFTSFRKQMEPLRERIPQPIPMPDKLAPLPPVIPPQPAPFTIPDTLDDLKSTLLSPISDLGLPGSPLTFPPNAKSAHPFTGGETSGKQRIHHLLSTGALTTYKDTRNGLLGLDFSCKTAAWLSQGCLSARLIHSALLAFETGHSYSQTLGLSLPSVPAPGFGNGENKGTGWLRFELLWRDYFRLCAQKFGARLFSAGGFRRKDDWHWRCPSEYKDQFHRFLRGSTGVGLVDASQRELYLTGWTSNRARQNVASFLAKRLKMDWRVGAEWYESLLVDYDVASNWGNWQYNAGVGNDPRGEDRVFNQIKQGRDYDTGGKYVRTWVPEVEGVQGEVWQVCTLKGAEREMVAGRSADGRDMVERPLVVIPDHGSGGAGKGKKEKYAKDGSGRAKGRSNVQKEGRKGQNTEYTG